ncbi:MAG: argininosuccinate lyase [Candidatus Micrarchaeota archaeon]|nr:argininosuccinate lyase [Candidatus Micrarchaeota archaeon]
MKLWEKGIAVDKEVEAFTVGNDYLLDQRLVEFDCIASIAHSKMLGKINVLTKSEVAQLEKGLNEIIALSKSGKFQISKQDEDCHTAIENYLTEKYGDVGKKIHTARSRNDQVLTALRLYEKHELQQVKKLVAEMQNTLQTAIKNQGSVKMPGYTHMQRAMPTTVATWLGSFQDALADDLQLLDATFTLVDASPLGTAAGFGVPVLEIDREFTAKELKFAKLIKNPIYAQLSRGKLESSFMHSLTQVMLTLNKLATDLTLFSTTEFSLVSLPENMCTGSSIMPQKKNPDVLELVRAKYHVVLAEEFKVKSIIANLPSGYNRDLQLTKEPLFTSIDTTEQSLKIMSLLVKQVKINESNCTKSLTRELFATEEAYKLVKKGVPFREAYRQVAQSLKEKK